MALYKSVYYYYYYYKLRLTMDMRVLLRMPELSKCCLANCL